MKIGIFAMLSESTIDPVSAGRKCEELGFESIWVPEHAIIPVHTKVPYPALDGKIPDVYTRFPDPFVLLGMMASVTRTLKLGTGICLVPERHPLALAKEVATLDYYSGGRSLFGIGAGWQAEESEIMGVDFPRRWPITRDYWRRLPKSCAPSTPERRSKSRFKSSTETCGTDWPKNLAPSPKPLRLYVRRAWNRRCPKSAAEPTDRC